MNGPNEQKCVVKLVICDIKEMQYSQNMTILSQAHNDLMRTYEAKLSMFGIPTEELGFRPLESTVGGQPLGQGPAGLVAAPN